MDRRVPDRAVPRRSQPQPVVGGCGHQRPRLRLVVDNTGFGPTGSTFEPASAPLPLGEGHPEAGGPSALATELGAWLKAASLLAGARWRLTRQRWVNRHGNLGLGDRISGLTPLIGLVAVVLFGALFGLRLAQESSSTGGLDGPVGSVAAVATASNVGLPAGSGPAVVVVHPGDSLWSIAVSRYPEHDPREVVDAFVEANGASVIRSGQQLVVPAALLED